MVRMPQDLVSVSGGLGQDLVSVQAVLVRTWSRSRRSWSGLGLGPGGLDYKTSRVCYLEKGTLISLRCADPL